MSLSERIGAINAARRDNLLQRHPVSTPNEHAADVVAMLLAAVAKEEQ